MTIWALLTNVNDSDFEMYGSPEKVKELLPGAEVVLLDRAGIEIEVGDTISITYNGKVMKAPDAFWPIFSNTDSFTIEKALMAAGSKSLINFEEYAVARSKSLTYQRLAANGIKVPKTFLFFDKVDKESLTSRFSYPFIIKKDNGYGGQGVDLIENEEQLDRYLAELTYGTTYNAQEFISSSRGTDLRVVLAKNKYFFSMQRKSGDEKEFKSNVHAGGTVDKVELNPETIAYCEKISRLFDLPLLGIDLLYGQEEGDYTVCEVNAFPGMTAKMLLPIVKEVLADFAAGLQKGED